MYLPMKVVRCRNYNFFQLDLWSTNMSEVTKWWATFLPYQSLDFLVVIGRTRRVVLATDAATQHYNNCCYYCSSTFCHSYTVLLMACMQMNAASLFYMRAPPWLFAHAHSISPFSLTK